MEAVQRQAVPVRDYLAQRHGYHFTIKAFLQTPRLVTASDRTSDHSQPFDRSLQ